MRQTMRRTVGTAVAAMIAAMATGCSGQIAEGPSDGGSPAAESSTGTTLPSYEAGSPGYADAGPRDTGTPPSGDNCGAPGVTCTTPPSLPDSGATPPIAVAHNYAVHTLFLGDTDCNGVASTTAWETYGYNLDNLVTTETSTDVCTLVPGAAKSTQVDGTGGIDNSFGANIIPILTTAATDFSAEVNAEYPVGHLHGFALRRRLRRLGRQHHDGDGPRWRAPRWR